jgi:hypothetical protein
MTWKDKLGARKHARLQPENHSQARLPNTAHAFGLPSFGTGLPRLAKTTWSSASPTLSEARRFWRTAPRFLSLGRELAVMDSFEPRFIVKRITGELESVFQSSALSRATVKQWLRKFKSGDRSSSDESRQERPLTIFGSVLKKFREKYPFANTKII